MTVLYLQYTPVLVTATISLLKAAIGCWMFACFKVTWLVILRKESALVYLATPVFTTTSWTYCRRLVALWSLLLSCTLGTLKQSSFPTRPSHLLQRHRVVCCPHHDCSLWVLTHVQHSLMHPVRHFVSSTHRKDDLHGCYCNFFLTECKERQEPMY